MAKAIRRHHGDSIPYTPTVDTPAGTVVVQGDLVGVTKIDIDANELGSLTVAGLFEFPKATGGGTSIGAGNQIFWDDTADEATLDDDGGNNKFGGISIGNAKDSDPFVRLTTGQPTPSAPPPFSPPTIPGLLAWYDASDNSTVLKNTTEPASNGDDVQIWLDKSGNGHHTEQLILVEQPAWFTGQQNGLPVISFGGIHNLPMGVVSEFEVQEMYIIVTASFVSSGSRQELISIEKQKDVVAKESGISLYFDGSDFFKIDQAFTPAGVQTQSSAPTTYNTNFRNYTGLINTANFELRILVNDVSVDFGVTDTVQYDSSPDLHRSLIGANYDGVLDVVTDPFTGDIGEIAIYSRELTVAERANFQSYSVSKWAV